MKKLWMGLLALCLFAGIARAEGVNAPWNARIATAAGGSLSGVRAGELVFGAISDEATWNAVNAGRDPKMLTAVDFKSEAIVYVLMHRNNFSSVRATSFKKAPDGWRLTVETTLRNEEIAMSTYDVVFLRVRRRDVRQVSIVEGGKVLGTVDVK